MEVLERLRALGILDGVIPRRVIRVTEARRCSRKQELESLSEEICFALYVFIERFQSRGRARNWPNKAHEVRRCVLCSRHGQSRRFREHARRNSLFNVAESIDSRLPRSTIGYKGLARGKWLEW